MMNPNTVVRAYRELEYEGVLELKHGSGAFIKESASGRSRLIHKAQAWSSRKPNASSRWGSLKMNFAGHLRTN